MGREKCARVIITGTVQGVGFRWRARQAALSLGLSGWIKNRLDGGVEAVFQGSPESVDQMIEWVRVGPPGAVVREVVSPATQTRWSTSSESTAERCGHGTTYYLELGASFRFGVVFQSLTGAPRSYELTAASWSKASPSE